MPKKTSNYVNNFVDTPKALDAEGKNEARKSAEIDKELGKNQATVLQLGIREPQKKKKIVCSRCGEKMSVYPAQIRAYVNDSNKIVCNRCI